MYLNNAKKIISSEEMNLYDSPEIKCKESEKNTIPSNLNINELISDAKEKHAQYESLIEKFSRTSEISDDEDEKFCKNMIIDILNENINHDLDFKIISCIAAHFTDSRDSFIDRGAFLATAFFKKDEFSAKTKESYKTYEKYLSSICNNKKASEPYGILKNFKKIENNNINNYSNYNFVEHDQIISFYDEENNPLFLQNIIKILQEANNKKRIKAAYFHFNSILDRTDNRTLKIYSDRIFKQLCDLSDNRFYDEQFKSLAYFLSKNFKYFYKALEIFKNTDLDTMRMYLLYAFDLLEEYVDFNLKIELHLKFVEMFMEKDFQTDDIVRNSIIQFVEKGMRLIEKQNNSIHPWH